MTTIVCNKEQMAGDLQMTLTGVVSMKTKCKTKVYKFQPHELHFPHEPFIVGFCGAATEIVDIVDFYMDPENYKEMPRTRNLSGLILTQSGRIFQFDRPDKWLAVDAKFAAMGSGATTALGALHHGATPKEAVTAASKVDPYTGMGVKVVGF